MLYSDYYIDLQAIYYHFIFHFSQQSKPFIYTT